MISVQHIRAYNVILTEMAGHGHGHNHENISIDWDSIKWDELSPEEKWNYEHLRMHQKHAGHAEMHAEMILILLLVLVVSQIGLVQWRKRRPYSYHLCTLVGRELIILTVSLAKYFRYVDHPSGVGHQEPLVEVSLCVAWLLCRHFTRH